MEQSWHLLSVLLVYEAQSLDLYEKVVLCVLCLTEGYMKLFLQTDSV